MSGAAVQSTAVSRRQIPAIVDINLPIEGIFHGCAIVAIRKERAGQARQVMEELWSSGWLRKARLLLVVDADEAPAELSRIAWKVINNAEWPRDLVFADGKIGLDATRKLPGEGQVREWPDEMIMSDEVKQVVQRRWAEYGF